MKTFSILLLVSLSLVAASCGKKDDPNPVTGGDSGSWSYSGTTYKGTYSAWSGNMVQSLADKPHVSSIQAYFNTNNPPDGNYEIATPGSSPGDGQVSIAVVDSELPAISYFSLEENVGTVKVSKSGGKITITIDKLKLGGFKSDATEDDIEVTGTIVK